AVADNAAFHVQLPNRKSFSPDAAYQLGKWTGMKCFAGAPVFAADVRSEGDYGPAAEREPAQKRADYFAAGTMVVWDVDVLNEEDIKSYRIESPEKPQIFRRGEIANAGPAVPGWTMPVDDLFINEVEN